MKKTIAGIAAALLLLLLLPACKKDKQKYSGTATIDNLLVPSGQSYAIFGFSFEEGRVISNLEPPGPDITIHLETDISGVVGQYFGTDNLVESFSLVAEYLSSAEASSAFKELKEVGIRNWELAAWDIAEHQLWLFKTSEGNYVKIRITDILVDEQQDPPYIQGSFEWQFQPDGSTSFSN